MIISHNELRDMFQKLGVILGYESISEYHTTKGRIDVMWKKGDETIAFEIENANGKSGQLKNLIKVLDFKPTKYIPVFYKFPEINEELKDLSDTYPIKMKRYPIGKEKIERNCEVVEDLIKLDIVEEERVERFKKITKASRATYYRTRRIVLKRLNEERNKEMEIKISMDKKD